MNKIVLSLLFFQFCVINCILAQDIITLDKTDNLFPIGKSSLFFLDANGLSETEILNTEFAPYHQDVPNFASTPDAAWFKFSMKKEIDENFYLEVGSAFIDSIFFYELADSKLHLIRLAGDNLEFSNRDVQIPRFILPLDIPLNGQKTYYLKAKSLQPLFFPLRVGTLTELWGDNHRLDLMQGIYLGIMFLIIFYNLFLFFSTKESIYAYYVAYVISITLFMSLIFHHAFEFIYPHLPGLNKYAVLTSALTIFTAVLFTRKFLKSKTYAPKLHKYSNIFIGIAVLIAFLLFTPFQIEALLIAQMSIMLMAFYFLVIGTVVLRKGFRPAIFYLIAWSFLIVGFVFAILESLNIVPVMHYINAMQIGSAIEVALLSLALGDSINIYKREREEAQALALKAAEEKNDFIQKQNEILEEKVTERTKELTETLELVKKERIKSDELLLNILPFSTAKELKEKGKAAPQFYEAASVLFLDIKDFSSIAEKLNPQELVSRLDELFQEIDNIVKAHNLEKIKTIGDAYMAAGGVPVVNDTHTLDTIKAALEIMQFIKNKRPDSNGHKWEMRCGIHTGSLSAGVVGRDKFAYDIWGNTVNLASRMESNGEIGKINISDATYQLVKDHFSCKFRGDIEVKNMGLVGMYYIES